MKELSIEEKAKAYDKAIEKAKDYYHLGDDKHKMAIDAKAVMEYIFPELRESEDERIRKWIIEFIKACRWQETFEINKDQCLAWLEAQGEHAKFRDSIQVGDKVTRNRDGVLVNLSQLERVAKKDEKQGEQILANSAKTCKDEQKPVWSEDDEVGLGDALWAIEQARTIAKDENDMGNLWYAERWLKSLKERYTWKPSDEQIKALSYYLKNDIDNDGVFGCQLVKLYQDLKKLREGDV